MPLLDRLFGRLLERIAEAEVPAEVVTVADVYQRLVPYRMVRGEIGVAELAEYEHTLMRLLAGERDYLLLGDPSVREELRRELASPNPILGLYRDYPTVTVSVTGAAPPPPPPPGDDDATLVDGARAPVSASPLAALDGTLAPLGEPLAFEAGTEPDAEALPDPLPGMPECWSCRGALPATRAVNFCPFCGSSQRPVPCPSCAEPVEPDWKFCAACGTARDAARR